MLPDEEIVRVCSLVVSTATGLDPLAHRESRKGGHQLTYARAIWVYLVVCEMGIDRGRASYLCDRSIEAIGRHLAEVEEYRSDPAFDERYESWAEAVKNLLARIFDFARLAPSPRKGLSTRAAVRAAA